MALLLITDGIPRTVTLAHKPPFTFEELRILIGCTGLEFHRLYKAGEWAWLFMDANAGNLPRRGELNEQATKVWSNENADVEQKVFGTAMLLSAAEFESDAIDGEDHEDEHVLPKK